VKTSPRAPRGLTYLGTPEETAGLLYGALVAASVLATASAHVDDFSHVAAATCFVLGVYWTPLRTYVDWVLVNLL